MSKWVLEIWTPYEPSDCIYDLSAEEALEEGKRRTKSEFKNAIIRPDTEEYELWEFEEAIKAGKIK